MTESERMTRLVRSLRGGQITIPAEFRKKLSITDETMLQITLASGELRVKPLRVTETAQGSAWLKELYDDFAPARREILEHGYTEEEINSAIDEAVAAVRNKR